MHILGIVGGIGPESTIEYYRSIIDLHRELRSDNRAPSVLINSIDVGRVLQMAGDDDRGGLVRYLLKAIGRLADAGAGFALLASNTPHMVFDRLTLKSPIPLISIVEVAVDEAKAQGLQRCALLGTRRTMSGTFYAETFAKKRIEVISPTVDEQERIHAIYVNELLKNVIKNESRRNLIEVIAAMKERHGVDSVILGGTELPLILKEREYDGVVVLDTTQIHVRAAVERMLR